MPLPFNQPTCGTSRILPVPTDAACIHGHLTTTEFIGRLAERDLIGIKSAHTLKQRQQHQVRHGVLRIICRHSHRARLSGENFVFASTVRLYADIGNAFNGNQYLNWITTSHYGRRWPLSSTPGSNAAKNFLLTMPTSREASMTCHGSRKPYALLRPDSVSEEAADRTQFFGRTRRLTCYLRRHRNSLCASNATCCQSPTSNSIC